MSFVGSLHYWFVMLFLQFVPTDDLRPGRMIRYSLVEAPVNGDLVFRIQEGSRPDALLIESLLAAPGGDRSRFRARIERQAGDWWLVALRENEHAVLAEGERLPLLTDDEDRILISTDAGYFFRRVSGRTRRKFLGITIPGHARARFREGPNSIQLVVHTSRGIQEARIDFYEPRMAGRIVRVPDAGD